MKFIRQAKLVVNIRKGDFSGYDESIIIQNLRVSFSVIKSLSNSTNPAIIKVWNLNQNTRNIIKDYGDEVLLYAGYERGSGLELLYIGDTTCVQHIFEQPDIVSIFECGDGEKYVNQLRVAAAFSQGALASDVIVFIAEKMGLKVGEISATKNLIYRQGFSGIDMGSVLLKKACDKLGLQWSVQNNKLQVIPYAGTIDEPPIFINEDTGMQGIPQRYTYKGLDLYRTRSNTVLPANAPFIPPSQPVGYKINVALNPFILPGKMINLRSQHLGIEGNFRVNNVRHEGDTYGFVWSTNIQTTEVIK